MYSPFQEEKKTGAHVIVGVSLAFHGAVLGIICLAVLLNPEKEPPPPIHFFEMVQLPPAAPAPKQPEPVSEPEPEVAEQDSPSEPESTQEPIHEPEPAEPEPVPEVVPKIEPVKPAAKPKQAEQQESSAPPKPSMDMPMDMPSDVKTDMNMPALHAVGNISMDSQLQAYLGRLQALVYQNFNPPTGTDIAKGTKASVYFEISRSGEISEVALRASSGNMVWDKLATRAVQITRAPPLPSNYTSDVLPLIFDFREK